MDQSQWPSCLRLSLLAQTLGSWVRIPLEVWMLVCVYSVFVLFCVQVAALRRTDPPSKESYRLYIGFFFFLVASTLGSLLPLLEHRTEFPQFLDLVQSVGLLGQVISSSQGLYLYTNTEKRAHIHKH
jgi:hypothetical protein